MNEFEITTLKSGLKTIRSILHRQTFHPGIGPMEEATLLHVNQQRLVERSSQTGKFVIWDVGFGAAANALAALNAVQSSSGRIEIHSFDKTLAAFEFALAHGDELGYLVGHEKILSDLLQNGFAQVTPTLGWKLHLGDFRDKIRERIAPSPNAIFYDPYSPKENPEMWSLDHFRSLRGALDPEVPCMLTNYTRSTSVRTTLLLAGFSVGAGCAIGEKNETTVAATHPDLLEHPLGRSWLNRVKSSTSSAPLRGPGYSIALIDDRDFKDLQFCAQFVS